LPDYVCMLRGVNVGGKKVEMKKLRHLFESIGLSKVRSYIQSGNVLFHSPNEKPEELQALLEKRIIKAFGFEVRVVIRSAKQIKATIKKNPFSEKDSNFLHVTFLQDNPVKDYSLEKLSKSKAGEEDFIVSDREVYVYCPNGYGRTKLNNTFFEKNLGVFATTRNWRTVNALASISS
jgi:uncharacterized protein (DUF1697 family)